MQIVEYITFPFRVLFQLLHALYMFLVGFFFSISLWSRIIIFMTLPGVLSVVFPSAQFDILGITYQINNPISIHIIFLVFLFNLSVFFRGLVIFIIRSILAGYVLIHYLVLFLFGFVTKAESYSLASGFFITIFLILVYGVLSILDYLYSNR
jgi:hypothetical protein